MKDEKDILGQRKEQKMSNDYTNRIEQSTPFIYPEVGETELTQSLFNPETIEFTVRLLCYVLPSRNPRLTLACLAYATGYDLSYIFQCPNNSESQIAKSLGVTKSHFSRTVKQISEDFDIKHLNTGKTENAKETYKENNFRIKRTDDI